MLHSPSFFADESALVLGIRSLAHVTISYVQKQHGHPARE